mgnify:CR=1 FL=1
MCEVSSIEVPLGTKNDVDWIARRGKWMSLDENGNRSHNNSSLALIVVRNESQGETPVTIPNTVVKTLNAYGTAEVTRWESRSMPNSIAGWGNNIFEFSGA